MGEYIVPCGAAFRNCAQFRGTGHLDAKRPTLPSAAAEPAIIFCWWFADLYDQVKFGPTDSRRWGLRTPRLFARSVVQERLLSDAKRRVCGLGLRAQLL